jgi:hypothetical protein
MYILYILLKILVRISATFDTSRTRAVVSSHSIQHVHQCLQLNIQTAVTVMRWRDRGGRGMKAQSREDKRMGRVVSLEGRRGDNGRGRRGG